jgi:divalent metal cation (Fe/Co/Zn/Cd) transporter
MAAERERLMAIDEPALRTSEQSGALLRRGRILEGVTLGWNVAGIAVLAVAAVAARSVALAGFGLDSLIEIGASTVVLWELSGSGEERQRRALRLIGGAFVALAAYLTVQSVLVLATGYRPGHSVPGIAWTAVTATAMFALAAGKARTGKALGNPVLVTEGRVTLVDGILATAVLTGLVLNAAAGWWWADPLAGSHQVQQRPGQVVLGGHDHVVVHPDVVDGDARGRAVRHRDTDGASGEILP